MKKSPDGVILIEGEEFRFKFKTSCCIVTVLDVDQVITNPEGMITQTSSQDKITIPGTVVMCNDDKTTCFEGFGVIRRASSITSDGTTTIGFFTDDFTAEVIGDSGFFELEMNRLQRTVT